MDCIQSQRKLKFTVGQEIKKNSKTVTATTKTLQSWIEFLFSTRTATNFSSRCDAILKQTHDREEEKGVQPFYLNQCLIKWWRGLDDRHYIQVQQLKRSIIFAKFVFARVGVVVNALNKPPNSHQTHHNHCTHSRVTQCTRSIWAFAVVAASSIRIHYLPTAQRVHEHCVKYVPFGSVWCCALDGQGYACVVYVYVGICGLWSVHRSSSEWPMEDFVLSFKSEYVQNHTVVPLNFVVVKKKKKFYSLIKNRFWFSPPHSTAGLSRFWSRSPPIQVYARQKHRQ